MKLLKLKIKVYKAWILIWFKAMFENKLKHINNNFS